jgi:hypothetical protein
MFPTISLHMLVLTLTLVVCGRVALAADLVLTGPYTVVEVFRDDSVYTGNDGWPIREGDHLHDRFYDPCNNYTGVKFMTLGVGRTPNGFLVVNDCQIAKCRKWTTEDGRSGGYTKIYDIVDSEEAEDIVTRRTKKWRVVDEPTCSCGEDCYVGKFLHVDKYDDYVDNGCEPEGAIPGSIPCEETFFEPTISEPSISEQVQEILTSGTGDGLSDEVIAAIVAAVAVATLFACCCFFYRRNRYRPAAEKSPALGNSDTDEESQSGKEIKTGGSGSGKKTSEVAVIGEASIARKGAPQKSLRVSDKGSEKKTGGSLSEKKPSRETAKEKASNASKAINEESQSSKGPEKKTGSSWFGKKTSSKTALMEASNVSKVTDEESQSGSSWFGKKSKPADEESQSSKGSKKKTGSSWFGKKTSSEAAVAEASNAENKTGGGKKTSSEASTVEAYRSVKVIEPEISPEEDTRNWGGLFSKTTKNHAAAATVKKEEAAVKDQGGKKKTEATVEGNTEAVECNCCGF